MDVGTAFISNCQSSEPVEPCECPLHDPSVNAQFLLRLDVSSCDAGRDAPLPTGLQAPSEVITLVRVKLLRAPSWTPSSARSHCWDRIYQALEHCRVMPVCGTHTCHQWDSPPIHYQMMFAPSTSPIGRIRPRFRAPLFAGMLEASSEALDQSSFPDSCNSSSSTW